MVDSMEKIKSTSRTSSRLRSSRSWHRRYSDSWYPELGALLLSTLSVVATAIILSNYDNKPSPKFAGLTLNAVIATFGTASKALLLFAVSNSIGQLKWTWFNGQKSKPLLDAQIFDDASRGPLGAFKMLFAGTRSSLASIGALILILALAFDPFVQLVISYELTTLFQNSTGASTCTAGVIQIDPDDQTTVNALNSAFWRDDFVWQVTDCSTGNCLWDSFETLVFENKCYQDRNWTLPSVCNVNITSEEVYRMNETGATHIRDCSVYNSKPSFPDSALSIEQNMSMSAQLLHSVNQTNEASVYLGMPTHFSSITHNAINAWEIYESFNESYPTGMDVSAPLVMISTFQLSLQPDWTTSLQVTTCEIGLSLHTYTLNSSKTLINSSLNWRQPLRQVIERSACLENYNMTYFCFRPESPSIDRWFSNRTQELESANSCSGSWNPSNDTQWCLQSDLETLVGDLGSSLNIAVGKQAIATGWIADVNYTNTENVWSDWYGFNYSLLLQNYDTSSSTNFDVWIDKGPERIMNNIAASLTKLALDPTINANGTDTVYGQTGEVVSLVRVKWLWLILPYGLCATSIIFVLLTIYCNRQTGTPLWKSSINALLYHGITPHNRLPGDLPTVMDMDEQAACTRAALTRCGAHDKLALKTIIETQQLNQEDEDEIVCDHAD